MISPRDAVILKLAAFSTIPASGGMVRDAIDTFCLKEKLSLVLLKLIKKR